MNKKILSIFCLTFIIFGVCLASLPSKVEAQTPTPTATPTPTSTPTPTLITTATPTAATSAALPETGILTPTFLLIVGGVLILFFASLLII